MRTTEVRYYSPPDCPAWEIDLLGDLFKPGVLTTDHAASSYGLPVLVIGGVAFGSAEAPNAIFVDCDCGGAGVAEVVAAGRAAGYAVRISTCEQCEGDETEPSILRPRQARS